MANYQTNMYNYLKRNGYSPKYEHAGIYCIKIDDDIVYIGKSHNMLNRVAQHYALIQMASPEAKYKILAHARRKGHCINFDVLYDAKELNYNAIKNEIGTKEGEYIRQYKPVLNTQIPSAEDWTRFQNHNINIDSIMNNL